MGGRKKQRGGNRLGIKINRKGVDSPENSGRQQGKTFGFPRWGASVSERQI